MTPEERAEQIVDDALWYDNTAYICNEPSTLRAVIAAQLAQALSDKAIAEEQSEQDTKRRLEAEEEAAYYRRRAESLHATAARLQMQAASLQFTVERQAVEIEQLKRISKLAGEL
jgi:predicted RNase H-like nuclease (RuvC/YqgF family)